MSCRLQTIRFQPLRCCGAARRRPVRPVSFLWNVQISAAWKCIKLMKLWTQKISREMNGSTKVRSICTDKSMKNSRVQRWHRSGCTGEQVNCPFCLFVRKMPETNFSPHAYGSFSVCVCVCAEGDQKKKKNPATTASFSLSDWRNCLALNPPPPLKRA